MFLAKEASYSNRGVCVPIATPSATPFLRFSFIVVCLEHTYECTFIERPAKLPLDGCGASIGIQERVSIRLAGTIFYLRSAALHSDAEINGFFLDVRVRGSNKELS